MAYSTVTLPLFASVGGLIWLALYAGEDSHAFVVARTELLAGAFKASGM